MLYKGFYVQFVFNQDHVQNEHGYSDIIFNIATR